MSTNIFKSYYKDMIPKANTLEDAKNYAKACGIKLDVKDWIINRYFKENPNDSSERH